MTAPAELDAQTHRSTAISLFNATWDLITKEDRTPEDDLEMVHRAHASRWHWGQVGNDENLSIGEWQVSRVHVLVGNADAALYHGQKALEYGLKEGVALFAAAYGHEAIARAHALAGRTDEAKKHIDEAEAMAAAESDAETAKMIRDDLATIR